MTANHENFRISQEIAEFRRATLNKPGCGGGP